MYVLYRYIRLRPFYVRLRYTASIRISKPYVKRENSSSSDGEVKTNGMENGGTENGIESHDQQNGECVNGLYKVRLILMW